MDSLVEVVRATNTVRTLVSETLVILANPVALGATRVGLFQSPKQVETTLLAAHRALTLALQLTQQTKWPSESDLDRHTIDDRDAGPDAR